MDDRAQILKDWIEREGRRQDWVAKQIGVSPQWLNYVVRGKKPLSDRLAHVLHETLGVPLLGDEQTTNNKPKKTSKSQTRRRAGYRNSC